MILFVHTNGERGGLALLGPSGESFLTEWEKRSSHSEVITSQFELLLKKADIHAEEVKKIVINIGPGSFTGIRVGLSFAKSLGYLFEIPMIPLNTLEIMAFSKHRKDKVLVTLPAINGHFYAAGYDFTSDSLSEVFPPTSKTTAEIAALRSSFDSYLDGSLSDNHSHVQDSVDFYRRKARTFKETLWNSIQPLYLRRSQAEEKLRVGLLKPIYGESESDIERNKRKKSD